MNKPKNPVIEIPTVKWKEGGLLVARPSRALKIALKMALNRPLPDRRPAGTIAGRRAIKWKNEGELRKIRIGQK